MVLEGREFEAEDAFLARLAAQPGDLDAAVGLAGLLEGRNNIGGALDVLVRALEQPQEGPLFSGALAQLLSLASRAPDGGALAIPLMEKIATNALRVPDPELKSLVILGLADALIRQARPEEALRIMLGSGGRLPHWSVLGPYGKFGKLDLYRAYAPETGDLQPQDDPPGTGNLVPWRLDTTFQDGRILVPAQFPGFGVVYLVSDIAVESAGEFRVRVSSPGSLGVFIDGRPVGIFDRFRESVPESSAFRVRFDPGRHRLMVKLARAGSDSLVAVGLETLSGSSSPLFRSLVVADEPLAESEATPWPVLLDEIPMPQTPAEVLTACWWWRVRNLDRKCGAVLERWTQDHPEAHLFSFALAEFLRTAETGSDPQRDLARARALHEKLAEGSPYWIRARLLLARMDLESDRPTEAWLGAEKVLAASAEDPDALWLQHRIAVQRGWNAEADERIERARAAAPGRADLRQAAADFYRRIGARSRLSRVLFEIAQRDLDEQGRADWLSAEGRDEEALKAWLQAIEKQPGYLSYYLEAARLAADLGRPDQGLQILDRAVPLFPPDGSIALRRAELLSLLGREEEATAQMSRAIEQNPSLVSLTRTLPFRGRPDPLAAWGADARMILAEARPPRPGADSALLADLSATLVNPQGGQIEFYQGVHRVYTRNGVEKEGELEVLPGALLDWIRIHKADGRILDVLPGTRRPISLPNLAPLDSFEYTWRRFIPPSELIPGGLDNRTVFMFQGADRDFVLSRFVVLNDPTLPVTVCANTPGLETTDTVENGLRIRSWTARSVPEYQPEPNIPDPMEVIPHVKLGLGVTIEDLGDLVESALAGSLRLDAPLPQWADDVKSLAGSLEEDALARALHKLVLQRVRPGDTPLRLGTPASMSASAGEGNRITIALALAQALGLRPRLVLSRPLAFKGSDLKCPSPDMFAYALVEIPLSSGPVLLDFSGGDVPFGTFPPELEGSDGLRVPLDFKEPARLFELPRLKGAPHQEFSANLELDGEGRARGSLRLSYRGFSAGRPRLFLRQVPVDRRNEALQELVGQWFPGARVLSFTISGTEDPESPMTFEFEIAEGAFARRTQAGFALPPVVQPLPLLSGYAATENRRFPLLFSFLSFQGTIRVKLPEGLVPEFIPDPVRTGDDFGYYSLAIRQEEGHLVFDNLALFPEQRIEPSGYSAFRTIAQIIDRAEKTELRITAPSPVLR